MPADQSKKLEKKRRIIESAYQLFREKNIYNTAVDDIVKASGIARGTFYLYVKDKSDLIEQLVFYKSGESMKEMMRQAASRAADAEDLEAYATVFINALIDSLIEHRDVLTVVNKNARDADGLDSNGNINLIAGKLTIAKSASNGGEGGIDYEGSYFISDEFSLDNPYGITMDSGMGGMMGQRGGFGRQDGTLQEGQDQNGLQNSVPENNSDNTQMSIFRRIINFFRR